MTFSLDLDKLTPALLTAAVPVVVLLILALVISWIIIGPGGADVSIGLRPLHWEVRKRAPADKTREDQLRHATEKLADVAKGLGAVAEADPSHETPARNWFQYLLENLGPTLAKGNGDNFRIAIWTVDPSDPKFLYGLAHYNFDRNADEYKKLERQGTVAGYVAEQGEAHYVPDESKDSIYRPRRASKGKRTKAKCMIAVPLGDLPPWAVMTVDVNRVNGLTDTQQEIIAAFGDLATLGAHLARLELSRQESETTPAASSHVGMIDSARKGGRRTP